MRRGRLAPPLLLRVDSRTRPGRRSGPGSPGAPRARWVRTPSPRTPSRAARPPSARRARSARPGGPSAGAPDPRTAEAGPRGAGRLGHTVAAGPFRDGVRRLYSLCGTSSVFLRQDRADVTRWEGRGDRRGQAHRSPGALDDAGPEYGGGPGRRHAGVPQMRGHSASGRRDSHARADARPSSTRSRRSGHQGRQPGRPRRTHRPRTRRRGEEPPRTHAIPHPSDRRLPQMAGYLTGTSPPPPVPTRP